MHNRGLLIACALVVVAMTAAACSTGGGVSAAVEATATPEQNDSAQAAPADSSAASVPADAPAEPEGTTFALVPAESEARFIVNEILNGQPKTVVGATNAVEGTITADYANPPAVTLSAIRVDLSTLVTDNSFRNRAVRDMILETGNPAYQYAEFVMMGVSGLPDSVTLGQPFDFQITGNLTIHGVTREVTFDATVTPVSETRLEGVASYSTLYSDFDVFILRLPPQVASVEDQVILELEFVAEAG
jgi:polyisoprenoid-binding protein YceI